MNIPTAEYQSVLESGAGRRSALAIRATATSTRSSSGAARTSRTGATSSSRRRRSTSRRRCTPRSLIDDLLRESKERRSASPARRSTSSPTSTASPKGADKTEFYQHDQNWTNRMILGDSLQVMASLAEREGLRGKVQCIYIDPPYGIKFNSNFQWCTTSRDVKDGNAGPHHPRAGAGQGVPRHLARRHPQLSDLSARPADRRARPAHGVRVRSSSRSAMRTSTVCAR